MSEKKKKIKSSAYNIALIAVFVAVITVCAWISIPFGEISFTLQLLGICLAGGLIGFKRSLAAVAAYILLGLIGVPVFSGFKATSALVGPTGGYIVGFLFTAATVGLTSDLFKRKSKPVIALALALSSVVGIALCYAFGTGWFMIMMNGKGNPYSLVAALSVCVVPFIPFDLIKAAVAIILSLSLKKFVKD